MVYVEALVPIATSKTISKEILERDGENVSEHVAETSHSKEQDDTVS